MTDDDAVEFEEWSDNGLARAPKNIPEGAPQTYRPIRRPPMALLSIIDDGRDTGEVIRIRNDRTSLGSKGDVAIAHDSAMAEAHAVIRRRRGTNGEGFEWFIQDISDDQGLFVRVRRASLRDGAEFLAGSHRYRFTEPSLPMRGNESLDQRLAAGSIPGQSLVDSDIRYASIQRQGGAEGERLWLVSGEYWIGRGDDCALACPDDPFLGIHHVLIEKHSGHWQGSTQGVTNGFWLRMKGIKVSETCTFMLGEQRFRLYVQF